MPKEIVRTHESYLAGGKKSAQTQKKNWANKSDKELNDWKEKMSLSHRTDRFRSIKAIQNASYHSSLSAEENDRQNAMRREAMKKWWSQFSQDERRDMMNKRFDGGAGFHSADSKPNLSFKKLLEDSGIEFSREFRLSNYSYDFKVGNVLIEIDPTVTHNALWSPYGNPISKTYHRDKSLCAKEHGFRCIHVFDWDDTAKIVSLLKKRSTVYARQCDAVELSKQEASAFLTSYHLQGYAKDSIRLGLKFNGELVAVMTFSKPRYNKNFEYELVRFCSKYHVAGGDKKLFSYFCHNYHPASVISYCDCSKFEGKMYINLGFHKTGESVSKHWYSPTSKVHISNNLLLQRGFDQLFGTSFGKGTSNEELMVENGFVPVYDVGQAKFEFISDT